MFHKFPLPFTKILYKTYKIFSLWQTIFLATDRFFCKVFFVSKFGPWFCHLCKGRLMSQIRGILLFVILSTYLQWFKKQCSEIWEISLFSKLIQLTNLEFLTNILMSFFLGKFISEIDEYPQKSEKFSSILWMHILLPTTHAI